MNGDTNGYGSHAHKDDASFTIAEEVGPYSPPTSPTKHPKLLTPSDTAIPNTRFLRSRASSTVFEDLLHEYVNLKCKDKNTRKDFDDATMESLRQLPLFQAIQVVHRFNDSVGPRVVNRSAFLVSIIRSTSRWWTSNHNSSSASTTTPSKQASSKDIALMEDGPNTHLIVQMCMNGVLNPDVFTPSVCHALQLLTPEQVLSVSQNFGSSSIALHVADDSYYAKQQLFLSLAHAALMNFPTSSFNASSSSPSASTSAEVSNEYHHSYVLPEATATEAAEIGRKRADAAAAAQLPGILTEFIARTLSNQKIRESEIDSAARDALKRVALIQAMQAMQHFSISLDSDQVQKKSAYLMGVLRGQEQHWERSRASRNCPGGAKDLLALHPRLLLKIAHLCLDGNLLPSDFSPEVCLELKDVDCDTAVRFVMAFNANKRICAGEHGGVKNRVGFFLGLLRNLKMNESGQQTTTTMTPSAFVSLNNNDTVAATELNLMPRMNGKLGQQHFELSASAKPFTPMSALSEKDLKKVDVISSPTVGPSASNGNNNNVLPISPSLLPTSSGDKSCLKVSSTSSMTPTVQVFVDRSSPLFESTVSRGFSPLVVEHQAGNSPSLTPSLVLSSTVVGGASPQSPGLQPLVLPQATPQHQQQMEAMEKRLKDMSRLLESSRDAISYLTSSLARSRTSELRLRRELQESQTQMHSLMQALRMQQDMAKSSVEAARNQVLASVQRSFDSLAQTLDNVHNSTSQSSQQTMSGNVSNVNDNAGGGGNGGTPTD